VCAVVPGPGGTRPAASCCAAARPRRTGAARRRRAGPAPARRAPQRVSGQARDLTHVHTPLRPLMLARACTATAWYAAPHMSHATSPEPCLVLSGARAPWLQARGGREHTRRKRQPSCSAKCAQHAAAADGVHAPEDDVHLLQLQPLQRRQRRRRAWQRRRRRRGGSRRRRRHGSFGRAPLRRARRGGRGAPCCSCGCSRGARGARPSGAHDARRGL
jgi:hypothetical protein